MIVTEDEAKTKWCPMLASNSAAFNKKNSCIGSSCMGWRKHDTAVTINVNTASKIVSKGFCGFAYAVRLP